MRDTFLPFTRPSIGDAEIAEVCEALRSGWITSGPRVEALQKAFSGYVGAPHALAVTSATAGFHIALLALGVGPGDDVITASMTWPSAVNMIHLVGARPVFADIDRHTLQIDPESVERVLTPRTRAVIPVHFAGQPCDIDRLRAICERNGLILLEDAAHAAGTEYRGRRVGSGGNPTVFSFHAIKNLTTGEGGMITTADDKLRDRLAALRFHGVDQDAWKRYAREAARGYDLYEPGFKYNLTDIQAALGLIQLRRLEEIIHRRTQLAELYERLLSEVPELVRPRKVPYPARHAWHLYTVLVDREHTGFSRDEFREQLRHRNIGTGLHFLAVHELSFYHANYPVGAGQLEHTEHVASRILSLPLFPDMRDDDVAQVVEEIRDVIAHRS